VLPTALRIALPTALPTARPKALPTLCPPFCQAASACTVGRDYMQPRYASLWSSGHAASVTSWIVRMWCYTFQRHAALASSPFTPVPFRADVYEWSFSKLATWEVQARPQDSAARASASEGCIESEVSRPALACRRVPGPCGPPDLQQLVLPIRRACLRMR
jgi:hypothetical protein